MYLLDRLLIRNFVKAYIICLVSLLTLYIVVDLFTNLDDFADNQTRLGDYIQRIVLYYSVKLAEIFDRLCEPIVLMAAAFTVAWMQRNNEMLPILSAGVSTRRLIRPILLSACGLLGLSVFNQEIIIPHIGYRLTLDKDDPHGEKDLYIRGGAYESNGIHIDGWTATRQGYVVKEFNVVVPNTVAGCLISMTAHEARYVPPNAELKRSGGWLMTGTTVPPEMENLQVPQLEMIDPGKWFLYTNEVDFDMLTRTPVWFRYASVSQLRDELRRPDSTRLAAMAVGFHMRFTRPILGVILVLMGLSIILRDQNRNIFISAGFCVVLCGLFFAVQFLSKHLGESDLLSPALAAWLPVLFFGPFVFPMFDAIHT